MASNMQRHLSLSFGLVVLLGIVSASAESQLDRAIGPMIKERASRFARGGSHYNVYEAVLSELSNSRNLDSRNIVAGKWTIKELLDLNEIESEECTQKELASRLRSCSKFKTKETPLMQNLYEYCLGAYEHVKSECPSEYALDEAIGAIEERDLRFFVGGGSQYYYYNVYGEVLDQLSCNAHLDRPNIVAGKWTIKKLLDLNEIEHKKCNRKELARRRKFCDNFSIEQNSLMQNLYKYCIGAYENVKLKCGH